MPQTWTEQDLEAAIIAVQGGLPKAKAARQYGIGLTTLKARISGRSSRQKAHEYRQRLSPVQERRLVGWALVQQDLGMAPTHSQLRLVAQRILAAGGDYEPIGVHWVQSLFTRNPSLATRPSKRIGVERFNGASTTNI